MQQNKNSFRNFLIFSFVLLWILLIFFIIIYPFVALGKFDARVIFVGMPIFISVITTIFCGIFSFSKRPKSLFVLFFVSLIIFSIIYAYIVHPNRTTDGIFFGNVFIIYWYIVLSAVMIIYSMVFYFSRNIERRKKAINSLLNGIFALLASLIAFGVIYFFSGRIESRCNDTFCFTNQL